MTKRGIDSKGNRLTRDPHRPAGTIDASDGYVNNDPNPVTLAMMQSKLMSEIMAFYSDHAGGYLKVRRAEGSSDLHLTWTWNLSAAAGTYVYVRVEHWRLLFGLELLQQKILEVESGARKPTPDKRGGGTPQA